MLPEQHAQFVAIAVQKNRDQMRARRMRPCSEPGCPDHQEVGGLCRWHYRFRRTAMCDPTGAP
jgi:hypothetical protein